MYRKASFRALLLTSLVCIAVPAAGDPRRFQHGIDVIVTPTGEKYLFWSSSGNPPLGADGDGRWTHDVFVAPTDAVSQRRVLIAAPEAQEPVSAAITDGGHIMVTVEDGAHAATIVQRFGLYDAALRPVVAYPQVVAEGGHSGHVAAAGNRFVVVYAEGWIAASGLDGFGSGRDIHAKIYDDGANLQREITLASGGRNGWPLVATSARSALIVWQRGFAGEADARLYAAVFDPVTGAFIRPPWQLLYQLRHYNYAVTYVPEVDRFLVSGTSRVGAGFAYLLDASGKILRSRHDLPPLVREATSAVNGVEVLLLTAPTGAIALSVANDRIAPVARFDDDHVWQGLGAVADFADAGSPVVYALSRAGLIARQLIRRSPGN